MSKRILNFIGTSWSRDKTFPEKVSTHFRKHSEQLRDKMCKYLFTADKLYFLLINFYEVLPGVFRNTLPARKNFRN